jgi:hypothetical protein
MRSALRSIFVTKPSAFAKFLWSAALLAVFAAIVAWFRTVDFYHRHFFDPGALVAADNLARIGFVFVLAWLIYAPGAGIAALIMPRKERSGLIPVERAVLGFGIGLGIWHVGLLILGVLGLYYRSVMIGVCLAVLLGSAQHFGEVAIAGWGGLNARFAALRKGTAIPQTIWLSLIAIAGVWLLLVRGLYPGGGGDYYTHYFYYYMEVLKNHGLAPNNVWYHYYYSKGYGLFFLSMLLTDPEAPALATFCCVAFAAMAIAALVNRLAPRSLWPACGALLYLLFNLVTISHAQGGEFQKDHEQITAMVVLAAWGLCMSRGAATRPCLLMVASTACAAAIVTLPMGVILGLYVGLLAGWAIVRRRWAEMWRYGLAGAAIAGTVLAILALNYMATGLISDQSLDLMLRFANFARLDQWGVIPQLVIVTWIRDNYEALAVPLFSQETADLIEYFMRLNALWVVLAGPVVAVGLVLARAAWARWRGGGDKVSPDAVTLRMTLSTMAHLGSLLVLLIAISIAAGLGQSVSFERFCTFFFPLIILLCIAICGWAMTRPLRPWAFWGLGWVLPVLLLAGTLVLWQQANNWTGRVARATVNAVHFLDGRYSLAQAYTHQDVGLPFGGINPEALAAWRHVEPGSAIWSTTVDTYCMAPGCWIESVVSFTMSPRIVDILTAPPDQEKSLLQDAGLNYFLVEKGTALIDVLPYSQLFSPETIDKYLGVKWTDGTAFLLTWIGPDTSPLGSEFFSVYHKLLNKPENEWFFFKNLVPQIASATAQLRATPWDVAPDFAWRHPSGVNVVSATYGQNCKNLRLEPPAINSVREGNATLTIKRACTNKMECAFPIAIPPLRDPAQGCSKDFDVSYRCTTDNRLRTLKITAPTERQTAFLDCTPGIDILDATYGQNCKKFQPQPPNINTVRDSNATALMTETCDGKMHCEFTADSPPLSDPAGGCAKDFTASYRCPGDDRVRTISLPPAAKDPKVVLDCPGIDILDATYGQNCKNYQPERPKINAVRDGNATALMTETCHGKMDCEFTADSPPLSDPAGGCAKDFAASYRCPGNDRVRTISLPPAAKDPKVVLDCTTQP